MIQSSADAQALNGVAAACPTIGTISSVAAVSRHGSAAMPQPPMGRSAAPSASQLAARKHRLKTRKIDTGAPNASGSRIDMVADQTTRQCGHGRVRRLRFRLGRRLRRSGRPFALDGRESGRAEIVLDSHEVPRVTLGGPIRLPQHRRHGGKDRTVSRRIAAAMYYRPNHHAVRRATKHEGTRGFQRCLRAVSIRRKFFPQRDRK